MNHDLPTPTHTTQLHDFETALLLASQVLSCVGLSRGASALSTGRGKRRAKGDNGRSGGSSSCSAPVVGEKGARNGTRNGTRNGS